VLGEPEVGQVGVLAGHEHVGRLDIAVYQPARVGGVERRAELRDQVRGARGLEPAVPPDQHAQVVAVDVAHRDEQRPVRLARLVDGNDVRVVERRRELRLTLEAAPEVLVLRQLRDDQLQRDHPAQADLLGEIDDAHAAATELALDPVPRDLVADLGKRSHAASLRRATRARQTRSASGRPRALQGQTCPALRRSCARAGTRP
jgi:hypothetical protein